MKYYLYRHIRLDTNEVFYVGIGSKTKGYKLYSSEYGRAQQKYGRTKLWQNIVNKVGYRIEILLESDDYQFIKQKEIEFIAKYGRKDLGLGPLVNFTDGGGGGLKYIISEETRRKMSIAKKGKPGGRKGKKMPELLKQKLIKIHHERIVTKETKRKLSKAARQPTYLYDRDMIFIKEFESLTELANSFKLSTGGVHRFIKNSTLFRKQYYFFYEKKL